MSGGKSFLGRERQAGAGRRAFTLVERALRVVRDAYCVGGSGARARTSGCRRAFTLIELLVVISIISLLMAILLTTLTRVRKTARATRCLANVRHLGLGLHARAADGDALILGDNTLPWWVEALGDRDSPGILLCPEAAKLGAGSALERTAREAWGGHYLYPNIVGSYGTNVWLHTAKATQDHAVSRGWLEDPVFRDFRAKHWYWGGPTSGTPGSVPLVFDCHIPSAYPRNTDNPPAFDGDFSHGELRVDAFGCSTELIRFVCVNRHPGGKIGMAFMDGSARTVGMKELWTLRWHRQSNTAGPWTTAGGVLPEDWPKWMRGFKDY